MREPLNSHREENQHDHRPDREDSTQEAVAVAHVTAVRVLHVGGIDVKVVRKPIKHLHISVHPPDGRVRVSAPLRVDDDAVRMAVASRLAWIRRKQTEFQRQPRQSKREFVSGESHWFEGRRYRLDLAEANGPPRVSLRGGGWMKMRVRPGTPRDRREAILYAWYRERLRGRISGMIAQWEPKLGVEVADWRIRRMKTRWGTCNTRARRIWLNSELAKKPLPCLEYVVVHEMVHLIERNHTRRFWRILDREMPAWRTHHDALKRSPLAHEDWNGTES